MGHLQTHVLQDLNIIVVKSLLRLDNDLQRPLFRQDVLFHVLSEPEVNPRRPDVDVYQMGSIQQLLEVQAQSAHDPQGQSSQHRDRHIREDYPFLQPNKHMYANTTVAYASSVQRSTVSLCLATLSMQSVLAHTKVCWNVQQQYLSTGLAGVRLQRKETREIIFKPPGRPSMLDVQAKFCWRFVYIR